jgi:glycine oxidase
MLAGANEAEYGEDALQPFALASAAAYPAFAAEVAERSGVDPGYERCGTLTLGLDRDDAEALRRRHDFLTRQGLPAEWLRGSECRELEEALSPRVRCGILSPDDHQVDPRRLTHALVAALAREGGRLETGVHVASVSAGSIDTEAHGRREAGQVVVAAGAWASRLAGLPPEVASALRPVKGQILRLRGERLVSRVLRLPGAYVVPRADGELVVGATSEELGFDERVTAGAVHELLRRAYDGLPGVTELELVEARASLRPGTRDNAPVLGATSEGTILACGHYRNGILLAPATADAIAELLATGAAPPQIAPFAPDRPSLRQRHADHAQR